MTFTESLKMYLTLSPDIPIRGVGNLPITALKLITETSSSLVLNTVWDVSMAFIAITDTRVSYFCLPPCLTFAFESDSNLPSGFIY